MRLLLIILSLSPYYICFAQTNQSSKIIEKIEKDYQINVYDTVNVDFFLYNWQEPPLNLSASNMQEKDKLLVLNSLLEIFEEFPRDLVSNTIRNIYLIDSLSKQDLPAVFSYNQSLYISAHKKQFLEKELLKEMIRNEFSKIFFDYYPVYRNSLKKINDEIRNNFNENRINEKTIYILNKLSLKYGVKIISKTTPGDIPIPFRQQPYKYYSEGNINKEINEVLPAIDTILNKYPIFYKQLVNKIFLFHTIKSNNQIIPSFSYYSNIYLCVYNQNGIVDYGGIEKQLQIQLSRIIYQNIIPHISVNKWLEFNCLEKKINPYKEIVTFVNMIFLAQDSLNHLALKDTIINKKYIYLKTVYEKFIKDIGKLDVKNIKYYANEINKKYGVNIYYDFTFPFQKNNKIITAGLSILSNQNPYQLQRTLLNIDTALNVYPKEMIHKYLKNIYFVEIMLYGKSMTSPGGTYSYYNKAIYISNVGNYNESLQKAFHHEFSSLVRKFSGIEFPKEQWILINDVGFSYSMNNYYHPSKILAQIEMNQQGFLELYSMSSFDNDVEVFTSWFFKKPKELELLAREHLKLKLKLKLLYDYYKKVIPEFIFSKEIEKILK